MSCKTCKTCVHWKADKEAYERGDSLVLPYHPGTYERCRTEEEVVKIFGHAVRYCKNPKVVFFQRPEHNAAAVVDGSEYMACLLTAEDFGCVLHEEAS